MKKAGIWISIISPVILAFSLYDLFGAKHLPIACTVSLVIVFTALTFLGPALITFTRPAERRKKFTTGSIILSVVLIVFGCVASYMHWLGARVEIIIGVMIFVFYYGALSFKAKYDKWRLYARSSYDAFFLSLFDFLGIGCLILGFLFKVQHWPLAELFTTIGLITLAIGVLAWNQKFKKEVVFRKEAEDQLKDSFEKIEAQKHQLEEKQKEIIDSITYARRIQGSLMSTEKYIENTLRRLRK